MTDVLISHQQETEALSAVAARVAEKIKQQGRQDGFSVAEQLELLQELQSFDFGRFLLQNQGINGFWTHYMLTHPFHGRLTGKNNRGHAFSPLEKFILDDSPLMLATQERFTFFLKENQTGVRPGATLACIPCGMMGELLYLDFQGVSDCRLVGIDYDADTLRDAKQLAVEKGLNPWLVLKQADAWKITAEDEYDLISSNGLSIYEPGTERLLQLYQRFYTALKPGGKLVTSFVTPPPTETHPGEWDLSQINLEHLRLQKLLFTTLIDSKFRCFRSSQETEALLSQAGFSSIRFIYDKARLFPTVTAFKPQ
ncbi:class I SAM-dependent methyltransferase [Legionella taurinensis]|uniref:Class I SAM-dependent methyltransferase n=1 Tax=Legionella taurinensis TaxID=70611 RepID=A0A3A5L9U7_9GAMM|nr:class I SAM-dependent methyltransferase [Legionella taurinensis]MDX1836341.1 class I SAM-dependent methyltransferase [Legionella taurinensis]PUT41909.1 class I SAM-dependent methyltransferase [Legionella taurinensis]PUT44698.1 class I SAM-dependent methyltransferase [Legionella taurinensis]PUT48018.1 class I SAM-dependent methyltransferase [Legionella taurinensis]PUT48831.1 class I SAM-dependent methyltransferase [Legionella taurinensis]